MEEVRHHSVICIETGPNRSGPNTQPCGTPRLWQVYSTALEGRLACVIAIEVYNTTLLPVGYFL